MHKRDTHSTCPCPSTYVNQSVDVFLGECSLATKVFFRIQDCRFHLVARETSGGALGSITPLRVCAACQRQFLKRTMNAASVSDTFCPFLLDSMVISFIIFLMTLSACLPAILFRLPWL